MSDSSHITRRLPLGPRQIAISVIYGAVLWMFAAILLRIFGPMGVYDGAAKLWLYALIIPGTLPFVYLLRTLARLRKDQIAIAYSAATAAATLLDGIAIAWFPTLYGNSPELVSGAGGTILWGVGIGLVLAFWVNRVEG